MAEASGIQSLDGLPDAGFLTEAWFRWRLFPDCIDPDFEAKDNKPLYSINEAAKLCGLNRYAAERRLIAVALLQWGHCGFRLKLFREKDCVNLRRQSKTEKSKFKRARAFVRNLTPIFATRGIL
jgi:hypothetical protein